MTVVPPPGLTPVVYRPFLAALWMGGAIVSFSLMAVAGRAVQVELDTFELMGWRSLIGLAIVCLLLARSRRGFSQIRTAHPGLHIVRNLFHFTGQNAWFFALTLIPLAQLVALEFTNPVWVALFAPFLLGERLTLRRVFAVALGFSGVLIVARPGIDPVGIGHAMGLLAALGFAMNTIWTKKIMAHDGVLCVLFWMTSSQTILGFGLGTIGGTTLPSTEIWPWLAVVGLTGITAHFSLTTALSLAPASIVAPMEFLRLPVLAVVGAMVYGEGIMATVLLGGAVIFAANLINMTAQHRPAKPPLG